MKKSICLAWFSLIAAAMATAEDWPQWQGPARTNISTETGLLQEWPDGGPKKVWDSKEAGLGYSGLAVVGDTIYTMGALEDGEHLIALNVADGSRKWSLLLAPLLTNNWGDGPRSTPTVDGDRVYALSGKGVLICVEAATGKEIWRAEAEKLGGKTPNWGYCESILVDGEQVVWTPGGQQGAVAAMNKNTGEKIWQSGDFQDGAQYASIVAFDHGGKRQYACLVQKQLVGLDAKTGDVLWKTDWPGRVAVIPTPIYKNGRVYISSGYGVGCKQIEISEENQVKVVYENKVMKNHHGGIVLLEDHLFGYSDQVGWVCQTWTDGERVWNEKNKLGKGSITFAGGRFYLLAKDSGECVLLEPSTEAWSEKGRFKLEPQSEKRKSSGRIWTHPTVANGRLYLRDQEIIVSYDIVAQ